MDFDFSNRILFMNNNVDLYVDGSFNGKNASWAYIIVKDDITIGRDSGIINDPIINLGFQVGGECKAVMEGLKHCKEKNYKATIYYDYTGLFNWVADLFNKPPWKTNKEYTKNYRNFILENKDLIIGFQKIKSHTGNYFNEEVDKLAKQVNKQK